MKKVIQVILFFFFATLLAFWSPWKNLDINYFAIFGVARVEKISNLKVVSVSGELEVSINNEIYSVTEESSPLTTNSFGPGNYLVTIKRRSDIVGAYYEFSRVINFEPNSEVVISINLGPSEEFSEWSIIVPKKKVLEQNKNSLTLKTKEEGALVAFGSNILQNSNEIYNSELLLTLQQNLEISKQGYEPMIIVLLPEEQLERDRLKNFNIDVEVNLMLQPLIVE